jgi:hypothetical protein
LLVVLASDGGDLLGGEVVWFQISVVENSALAKADADFF